MSESGFNVALVQGVVKAASSREYDLKLPYHLPMAEE